MELRPVQDAANPSSLLAIATQINGGGYTDVLTLSSGAGIVQATLLNTSTTGASSFVAFNDSNLIACQFGMWNSARSALGIIAGNCGYIYASADLSLVAAASGIMRFAAKGNSLKMQLGDGLSVGTTTDPGAGKITALTAYNIGSNQVLQTRKTGWGLPTGTLFRTALSDASTQAQFNQALMALITDLHGTAGHGLIGT